MVQIPFPNKKYQIIYADPPWSYRDKALAGNRGAGCKYLTQEKTWIDNLSVSTIADENCALFLWVTMPKLNECWELIENWGFEYKTVAFTWVKKNKKADSWFWGMGRWTRANAELCLLATKGKPKRLSAGVHSVVDSPIERHSQKPKEVRKRIVDLLGDIPRIELFAREETEGWDAWGNEIY
jgi:N6-adenosine-specific RNA methylase IME4